MPTRRQLSRIRETEFEYPQLSGIVVRDRCLELVKKFCENCKTETEHIEKCDDWMSYM